MHLINEHLRSKRESPDALLTIRGAPTAAQQKRAAQASNGNDDDAQQALSEADTIERTRKAVEEMEAEAKAQEEALA